ncbi:hypothetical protein D3C75_788500 [compost metagenome]
MDGVGKHVIQLMKALHRASNAKAFWQAAEGELGQLIVIRQLATGLTQQLIDRHVAAGHAQQVAVQGQSTVGDLALAGDLANVGTADMTHAFFMQCLVDGTAEVAGNAALFQSQQQGAVYRIGSHVHQCCYSNTLFVKIQSGEVTVVVAGQYHGAFTRSNGIQLHQTLRRAGQHHAGQVVVAEDHRLVE